MASLTEWTWVWDSSGRWWRIGKPGCSPWHRKESDTTERLNDNNRCMGLHLDFLLCSIDLYVCCFVNTILFSLLSVQFSCWVVSSSLQPNGLQHARPLCPSSTLRAYSNSCPLSQWCHPTISSSVVPFSFCLQSFPASGSFPMSPLFTSGSQSIGASASASVLQMNIQDWFPLRWTGWISLQSKGLSRVFSNTTVRKHQFFGAQPLLRWSGSHNCTGLLEKP